MYFEAYKKANQAVEQPAQTEYRLFAEITRELETANSDASNASAHINALFRNSQLWLTLKMDLMSDKNKLDVETKAGLLSLAIWVNNFTSSAMRERMNLEPLITVNKQIMQGLNTSAKSVAKPVQASRPKEFSQISI